MSRMPLREEDDFSTLTGLEQLESLREIGHRKFVGHHRPDIEAGFEETRDAIPRIEQASAGDAVDADAFEDDFVREVEAYRALWDAEEADAAAILHRPECQMQR